MGYSSIGRMLGFEPRGCEFESRYPFHKTGYKMIELASPLSDKGLLKDMTEAQIKVYEPLQESLLENIREYLTKAREAHDSIVRLPFFNEKGKRVTLACNRAVKRVMNYWIEMAQISYYELKGDHTKELCDIENSCKMSVKGRPLG